MTSLGPPYSATSNLSCTPPPQRLPWNKTRLWPSPVDRSLEWRLHVAGTGTYFIFPNKEAEILKNKHNQIMSFCLNSSNSLAAEASNIDLESTLAQPSAPSLFTLSWSLCYSPTGQLVLQTHQDLLNYCVLSPEHSSRLAPSCHFRFTSNATLSTFLPHQALITIRFF